MSDLPKFMLKPYRDGYGFSLGTGTITTQTMAGLPRQRKAQVGTVHKASVTYKCTRAMWQYMLAFLRANEAKPFLAYLLIDDIDHAWYECRYVNTEINVTTLGDQIFTAQLELIIKPKPINIGVDEAIIAIYKMSKNEQDNYFNQLEKLVNSDLPKIKQGA